MNRHEAALDILEGTATFSIIVRLLAAAADQAAGEGVGAERDPAVRVIAYQLARLCRVDEISYGYDPATLADTYCTLMNECKTRAREADDIALPLQNLLSGSALRTIPYHKDRRITR